MEGRRLLVGTFESRLDMVCAEVLGGDWKHLDLELGLEPAGDLVRERGGG